MPATNRKVILFSAPITANGTALGATFSGLAGALYLAVDSILVVGGAGGTIDAYIQTSFDGVTWADIANHHFTTASAKLISAMVAETALAAGITPTDGSIAANTILSGLLGDAFRAKVISNGTAYSAGTTLTIYGVFKGNE